jgi:hypothetical protein
MEREPKMANEKVFETGMDESFKQASTAQVGYTAENERLLYANLKRTYDEYQQESLESIKRNRSIVDKLLSDAQQYDNQRQAIANQSLQNAVETANMVAKNAIVNIDALQKQHTSHRDVATDNLWNPVQQGAGDAVTMRSVTLDDVSLKSLGASIAAAVAAAINPPKA